MFHVGQKVICVNSEMSLPTHIYRRGMDGLMKGRIYTVRTVGIADYDEDLPPSLNNLPVIRVVEIVRRPADIPYWAHRFRPVVERKTDISIFTAMLNGVSEKKQRAGLTQI